MTTWASIAAKARSEPTLGPSAQANFNLFIETRLPRPLLVDGRAGARCTTRTSFAFFGAAQGAHLRRSLGTQLTSDYRFSCALIGALTRCRVGKNLQWLGRRPDARGALRTKDVVRLPLEPMAQLSDSSAVCAGQFRSRMVSMRFSPPGGLATQAVPSLVMRFWLWLLHPVPLWALVRRRSRPC